MLKEKRTTLEIIFLVFIGLAAIFWLAYGVMGFVLGIVIPVLLFLTWCFVLIAVIFLVVDVLIFFMKGE